MKKLSIDELTRLAFVWAEQDRASLAECWPESSKEKEAHLGEYKQLHEYRVKRWGRVKADNLDKLKAVSLTTLMKRK